MKPELRKKLFFHISQYALKNEIYLDLINGVNDHVHSLISLHPGQSPAKIINLLKGESSNWVNKNNFLRGKFAWQDGYGIFSVSANQVSKVRQYIKNQEEHHRKMSFREELDRFFAAYGIEGKCRERHSIQSHEDVPRRERRGWGLMTR